VSGQPAISTSLSVATHLVRYANPSSDWRYSSIELVYVAGMATISHLARLDRNNRGLAVTRLDTILRSAIAGQRVTTHRPSNSAT
jgi:hypothetical protein